MYRRSGCQRYSVCVVCRGGVVVESVGGVVCIAAFAGRVGRAISVARLTEIESEYVPTLI